MTSIQLADRVCSVEEIRELFKSGTKVFNVCWDGDNLPDVEEVTVDHLDPDVGGVHVRFRRPGGHLVSKHPAELHRDRRSAVIHAINLCRKKRICLERRMKKLNESLQD